jgi:hypothetical protein
MICNGAVFIGASCPTGFSTRAKGAVECAGMSHDAW